MWWDCDAGRSTRPPPSSIFCSCPRKRHRAMTVAGRRRRNLLHGKGTKLLLAPRSLAVAFCDTVTNLWWQLRRVSLRLRKTYAVATWWKDTASSFFHGNGPAACCQVRSCAATTCPEGSLGVGRGRVAFGP